MILMQAGSHEDGVQIMKDYMASGSFARGRDSINAYASMVFVGNINQPVDTLVKTSHLFAPFPETMIDSAFFDRFHAYVPGWEIPKMRPEFFTNQYGLIVDYLAEWLREMRKRNFGDAINKYFKLGRDLNQRDTIAVKHTVSGLLKLLYPNEEYDKEAVRRCLEYALEARRRVKEQLKKIGGMEFVVAAVALQLVQDLEEDPQDQVTARAAAVVGLAVDVEEDDIGVGDDGPLDVAKEHGVLDLALEELDRLLALAVVRVRARSGAGTTAP